jgi:hypothetical protein
MVGQSQEPTGDVAKLAQQFVSPASLELAAQTAKALSHNMGLIQAAATSQAVRAALAPVVQFKTSAALQSQIDAMRSVSRIAEVSQSQSAVLEAAVEAINPPAVARLQETLASIQFDSPWLQQTREVLRNLDPPPYLFPQISGAMFRTTPSYISFAGVIAGASALSDEPVIDSAVDVSALGALSEAEQIALGADVLPLIAAVAFFIGFLMQSDSIEAVAYLLAILAALMHLARRLPA